MGIDELPAISSRYEVLMNNLLSSVNVGIDELPAVSSRYGH